MHTCDMNTVLGHWIIGICHIQTYGNKKTCRLMNLCAHTTHTGKSPDRSLFSDSSIVNKMEVLFTVKDITDWGVRGT